MMSSELLTSAFPLPLRSSGAARLTAGARADGRALGLAEHVAIHGRLLPAAPGTVRPTSELLQQVTIAGRGGAGFPLLSKITALGPGRAVVVVNGAEGEPAIWKDRLLLTQFPHLVLDGASVAADLVRATAMHVVVGEGFQPAIDSLRHALAERAAVRYDRVRFTLTLVEDRFVAGESSAVVARIDRGLSLPAFSIARTSERGVGGRPTLLCNAETFAQLGFLTHHGAVAFRRVGTPDWPGSMLVTVRGAVANPCVMEVPLGTRVGEAIAAAGGASEPLAAVLTGGYHGRWAEARAIWRVPLTIDDLAAAGWSLGAGLVLALPTSVCPLGEAARAVRYLADQTAGQCGPCVNGLPAMSGALEALARGHAPESLVTDLRRWCGLVEGRGVCRHPDGTAGFVRSVLEIFSKDVGAHLRGHCNRPTAGLLPV